MVASLKERTVKTRNNYEALTLPVVLSKFWSCIERDYKLRGVMSEVTERA